MATTEPAAAADFRLFFFFLLAIIIAAPLSCKSSKVSALLRDKLRVADNAAIKDGDSELDNLSSRSRVCIA